MHKPIKLALSFGIAMTLGLGAMSQVHAIDSVEATVDYRKGVMRAIGGNTAALAAVIVDGANEYRDNLAIHARYIVDMTKDIPALFPEGSDFGETNALPAVWENQERYAELSENTHKAAVALLGAIEGGEQDLGPRFRELRGAARAGRARSPSGR
ncbi:c-type cytochrome [Thioalkalivibrio sulfidiphilus]|uniref:c-type cytochrome n=1 Tax=Thioalkalivibrio sulfidiphilus TaxID=1033854 RepID=UPI003BB1E9E5